MHNFRSSLRVRVVTVDVDDTSHLAATLLQEILGNVLWYILLFWRMATAKSLRLLRPSNEVAALLMLTDVRRPHMMTTHDDHEQVLAIFCTFSQRQRRRSGWSGFGRTTFPADLIIISRAV